jgi:hypothetical protein
VTCKQYAVGAIAAAALAAVSMAGCTPDVKDANVRDQASQHQHRVQTSQGADPCGGHSTTLVTVGGRRLVRDLTGVVHQSETPARYGQATGSIACP